MTPTQNSSKVLFLNDNTSQTPKQDKNLRTEWLKALKTGKYKQGKGQLIDSEGKHCCLGVLCEVYNELNSKATILFEGQSYPPAIVLKAVGLKSSNGEFDDHGKFENLKKDGSSEMSLALLNDADFSFGKIANIIEQHKELFTYNW